MEHRAAWILSIGDELVRGESVDTNSAWLSARLIARGVSVVEHRTVADDAGAIADALRDAAAACDLVVTTGGLGPTADDLTRESLARATEDELVEDADALAAIGARYAARGLRMPAPNRVQALRPSRARMLANPHGTAPGLFVGTDECDVFCLPGPPREMRPMFEAQVGPALRPPSGRVVRTRVLRTVGIGESDAAERLDELMDRSRAVPVGTTASAGEVQVRIRAEGPEAEAEAGLDECEAAVRARLEPHVFGVGEDSLAGVVLGELRGRGERLATVESCTGGLIGAELTAVPGSSDVFVGGWVTYSDGLKTSCMGVPERLLVPGGPGAVSGETALAMARGGRERGGADWCLSVTGIAGPGGGSADKPVGTVWIALAGAEGARARRFRFVGGREAIRAWSVRSAFGVLLFALRGVEVACLGEVERLDG